MKYVRTDQYESTSNSWLNYFRKIAKTNKYAKGKEYCVVIDEDGYNIYEYKLKTKTKCTK
tara:strand:+ start:6876 stop:7055 length:180 start_codon:yes stop_codon:yes gene_type:complete